MTDLTGTLVDLVRQGPPSGAEWLDLGERAVVDTVGVLLAGADDPAVRIVAGTVDEHGGPVRSLATGRALGVRSAALVDGTAAHALDFDDVDDAQIAHPSAVLVPALLAAAQQPDLPGAAVLDAYAVGVVAGRAVAGVLGVAGHYGRGWHSTGTIGAVSATAALARLHRLDADATRRALGVAGSLAAGSRQNFGTMTKPLHAGVAADHALLAVRLAAGRFTADRSQLDGPLGFLALHGGASPGEHSEPGPAAVNIKLFPCCYATHSAAEAAIVVSHEVPDAETLCSIEVVVPAGGLAPLVHHRPRTGAEAKFSMEFVVAEAMLHGRLGLASFTDDHVGNPAVQQLLQRVSAREEADTGAAVAVGSFARVTARDDAGREYSAAIDRPLGHAERGVDEAALEAKFADCTRGLPGAMALYTDLRRLREQPSIADMVGRVAGVRS